MTNKQAYAGLLERLVGWRHVRELWFEPHGTIDVPCDEDDECSVGILRNPDGPEAAEAISSLLKALEEIASSARGGDPLARDRDADTLAAIARHAERALNSDAPLSIGEGDRG